MDAAAWPHARAEDCHQGLGKRGLRFFITSLDAKIKNRAIVARDRPLVFARVKSLSGDMETHHILTPMTKSLDLVKKRGASERTELELVEA